MPECTIVRGGTAKQPSIPGSTLGSFTGDVFVDRVVSGDGFGAVNVNFCPKARTAWHFHSGGQFLRVTAGSGWVCDKGGKPQKIYAGDVIWCPAGTTHWHGADDDSYMVHQAVSLGKVEWYEKVTDEEYAQKSTGSAES